MRGLMRNNLLPLLLLRVLPPVNLASPRVIVISRSLRAFRFGNGQIDKGSRRAVTIPRFPGGVTSSRRWERGPLMNEHARKKCAGPAAAHMNTYITYAAFLGENQRALARPVR